MESIMIPSFHFSLVSKHHLHTIIQSVYVHFVKFECQDGLVHSQVSFAKLLG